MIIGGNKKPVDAVEAFFTQTIIGHLTGKMDEKAALATGLAQAICTQMRANNFSMIKAADICAVPQEVTFTQSQLDENATDEKAQAAGLCEMVAKSMAGVAINRGLITVTRSTNALKNPPPGPSCPARRTTPANGNAPNGTPPAA